jgi:hypothetical protein
MIIELDNGNTINTHRTDEDNEARNSARTRIKDAEELITALWLFIEDEGSTDEFFALRERVRNFRY